jgi:hypothetical protein
MSDGIDVGGALADFSAARRDIREARAEDRSAQEHFQQVQAGLGSPEEVSPKGRK